MTPPNRQTTGGRAYLDLRAKAKREGRPTDELLVLYILERFLYRLSISEHRSRLVLKGGMLLAAFDERRPTADVDLLAHAITNDVDSIAAVAREVLSVSVDDGVTFEPDGLRGATIRDAELYPGVRIVVPARIDRARDPLRLDINVGDPVTPAPVTVRYPTLLGGPFELLGYPLATVQRPVDCDVGQVEFDDPVVGSRRLPGDGVEDTGGDPFVASFTHRCVGDLVPAKPFHEQPVESRTTIT